MIKRIILESIKFYKQFISQMIGRHCRFYPSCSEYSYQSVKKHGVKIGLYKTIKRVMKCHPFNEGGIDLL